jgi:hypothetical protein
MEQIWNYIFAAYGLVFLGLIGYSGITYCCFRKEKNRAKLEA